MRYLFRDANDDAPTAHVGKVCALKIAPRQVHGHETPLSCYSAAIAGSPTGRLSASIETKLHQEKGSALIRAKIANFSNT